MHKAVLAIYFGTSDSASRRAHLMPLTNLVNKAFPDRLVWEVFLSEKIRRKIVQKGGDSVFSLQEALDHAARHNVTDLLLLPVLLFHGPEYNAMLQEAASWKGVFRSFSVTPALLEDATSHHAFLSVLSAAEAEGGISDREGALWVFHGYDGFSPAEQKVLREAWETPKRRIAFLEGGAEDAAHEDPVDAILSSLRSFSQVRMFPGFLNLGFHVRRDLIGEQETSWKSRLEQQGIPLAVEEKGLGAIPAFQAFFQDFISAQ